MSTTDIQSTMPAGKELIAHHARELPANCIKKEIFSDFSCMFLNPNIFFPILILKTVRKRKRMINGCFTTISGHFIWQLCDYISQNWGSDSHFDVITRSKPWLIEKLWLKMQIFFHFPFLWYCRKKCICVCCSFGFYLRFVS